ncbi:MAG TPA: DUF3253 domain-containing protein [Methylibium sp.]|uniref:DUF3253 domain-containing protein n=1 Tax=Methylibium sp. TaxID=2067992 RepID=UPI002DB7E436|nr:DUF3253 domain-containing protein [Methylibium sp.]HEU4458709.1 DUF3253 domain-containing protein [Methylibium sp.]
MADDSKPAPSAPLPSHAPNDPPSDAQLAALTLELIARRRAGATICPSEVARAAVNGEAGWRTLMPRVREVAATLAGQGRLRVTQRGEEVDAREARGAIRLGVKLPR